VLYSQIRGLLGGTLQNVVKADTVSLEIDDDFMGTYAVEELRLSVGDDIVAFKPIGTSVVGAIGRVDMQGDRDQITLLCMSGPGDWQFVVQRVPELVMVPLDEESLLVALKRVMAP
ncbi:MAG TPA: hypothetical protein VGL53_26215, partial [Bryobacteraceae bacterium]